YRNVAEGHELDELMTDKRGFLAGVSLHPGQVQDRFIDEMRTAAPELLAPAAAEVVLRMWLAIAGMFFAFAGAAIETALSSAYNVAQFFGWPWGKHRKPRDVSRWTVCWMLAFVLATLVVMTGVDPIRMVEYSIVFSVVVLPLTYFPLMALSRDREVMGAYANGPIANAFGWFFFVLITIAAVAAIPLLVLTHGGEG
ncbi:MAG TPA: divalent metal cation transporter, partial [Lysobacter sp.]|nr:divalent metal cation transporter [Lysobacter sp.]